jgi:AcrR family transcriptional regulator
MSEPGAARGRRADALQNRARIVEVARDALTADSDASLNSIAQKAGVGPGTLYRHFPNREALVLAVYRAEIERLVEQGPELLARLAPLAALRELTEQLAALIRIKRGLGDALTPANHEAVTTESHGPVVEAIGRFLLAGERDGTVRPGLDPDDVLVLMGAVWRVPAGERADRLLDLVIESLRAR